MKIITCMLGNVPDFHSLVYCLLTALILFGQPEKIYAELLADCDVIEITSDDFPVNKETFTNVMFNPKTTRKNLRLKKPDRESEQYKQTSGQLKHFLTPQFPECHQQILDHLSAYTLNQASPVSLSAPSLESSEEDCLVLKTEAAVPVSGKKRVRFADQWHNLLLIYRVASDSSIGFLIRTVEGKSTYLLCLPPVTLTQSDIQQHLLEELRAGIGQLDLGLSGGACGP